VDIIIKDISFSYRKDSMNSKEDVEAMLQDCEDREDQLSDWEMNFIESLQEWTAEGKTLTEKQDETLDKIWEKVT